MNKLNLNKEQELGSNPKISQFLIANAGSGKTFVLIERFKNIINIKLNELSSETINRFQEINSNENLFVINSIANQELILKEIIENIKDNFNFYFFVISSFSEKTSFDLQQKGLKKLRQIKNENYIDFKFSIEKYKNKIKDVEEFFNNIQNDKLKEEEDIKKLFENHNIFDLVINNQSLFRCYLNIKFIDFFIENFSKFSVSTIHSFCIKIINEFYYEMNLEPDYKVKDFYLNKLSIEEAFIILNDPILLKLYNEKYGLNLSSEIGIDGKNDFEKVSELLFIFYNLYIVKETNPYSSNENNLKIFFSKIAIETKINTIKEAINYFELKIKNTSDENDIYKIAKEFNEDLFYLINIYFKIIKGLFKKYNLVDFNEQLLLVESFVKDNKHSEIIDKFANRIEYLMVDEFQDSDIIQTSIFETLATKNKNMSLFFVGDPKQSIYKFRGSDIMIFNKSKEFYKDNNNIIENYLETSYRSTPNLSSYINDFFDRFLEDKKNDNKFEPNDINFEYNNLRYPSDKYYPNEINVLQNPSKYDINFENLGRIDINLGYKSKKVGDKVKSKKWEEITEYILDLVEHHKILDKNKDNETIERKLEFRDIAILSRINFKDDELIEIKEVFNKKNINYELNKSSNFYEDSIIKGCVGFLQFIYDNSDDNAFYNLLVSEFYGFDDETLFFAINIILKLNKINPEEVKYYSLWNMLKLINELDLELTSEKNDDNLRKEIEDNLDFLIFIKTTINELNSYLKLFSKVFASELLIMFLKNNYFYNNLEQFLNQNEINTLHLNINKFLQVIHNKEKSGFVDFSELMNELKNLQSKDDEDSLYYKSEDNSVKMLTIHNSKGLEFPVVILVGSVTNSKTYNECLERETGIINNFEELADFDKQYLMENKIFNDKSLAFIEEKIQVYNKHIKNISDKNSNFNSIKTSYEELENLNLTYVAFTRAINVFCVFHELSYETKDKYHGTDMKSLKYIIPKYLLDEFIVNIKNENLLENKIDHIVKFYSNDNNANGIEYKIPINLKLYYKNETIDENTELIDGDFFTKAKNDINNGDSIDSTNENQNNIENYNNLLENKNYIFEVKDKFFSATKLLSLNSQKLNYEFKYLLGMNDRLALQLEEEEKSENNNLSEFDEFDLYNFSIFNKETKEKITKEIYDKRDLNLKTAAEFGLSFHFIMQNIKFLFDRNTKELNNDILEELLNECKNQYKLLDDSKIERIKLILNKMSCTEFLATIFENFESIKTEFSLNIPFYKVKDNETLHFLNGNLDLIYKNKENEIIIIDWKTNFNVDNDTRENYKMQATMYKYMISNLYPDNKIRFQFVFTKDILEKIDEKDWIFEPDLNDDISELEENIKDKICEIISLETHLYD